MRALEVTANLPALQREALHASVAETLAELAVQALIDEAELTPKPGLVDRRSSGAHHDLTIELMLHSARSLGPYFNVMACAAQRQSLGPALREELGAIGRDAEDNMLAETRGVNTHRGAIWTLGLLVAAAAYDGSAGPAAICATAGEIASIPDRYAPQAHTHGQAARLRYGVPGARGEAVAGFPHVHRIGLPALRAARRLGHSERHARLDALLAIMEGLPDTCLLHRGGPAALEAAQFGAQRTRSLGGYATAAGRRSLQSLDATLLELWASPGGSADLLAATLFLDALTRHREGSHA